MRIADRIQLLNIFARKVYEGNSNCEECEIIKRMLEFDKSIGGR